ncbi:MULTISPECIES: rRNA maturation RNase YbeY [unclassified Gemella]|uniref:rRNA maturation RNase YbeY n=1 Tax=unclassified Gemella TaxID=2624949 RepID=UPI00107330C8|nr:MULTISPECIES: rRNA maturation RNase YbeY [unclassified Gemella]MBF0710152.1 rRNA maturation RNase YbeY [Gemella sp. GL1.1]MBF0746231.1 rRNA maturation RNase YbeY [Gemella sp. 19428wG2_WT2a]NYS27496.1 rRNA maturation RNase YbeY [Gemella sp. GL1]TFU60513.1 rRNA maturation RNase YbeY [Gemella sp. WT2a]
MEFVEIIDDKSLIEERTKDMLVNLLAIAAKLENIDTSSIEFSLSFVEEKDIQNINKEYRGIDKPTDVITFALNDEVEGELEIIGGEESSYIGDIVVCTDKAKEQSKEYGHSYERELGFLAVHGFLHLLGYDHMNEEDEKIMFNKQDRILEKFGLFR